MGHLAISDIGSRRHHSAERFSRASAGLAGARFSPLRVWVGPWSISSDQEGVFPLRLEAATADFGIDLTLQAPKKPIVLQGDRGLSQKGAEPGNASYYYSYTRLPTRGEIRIGGQRFQTDGNSWFDREWSSSALASDQAGWDWFALQLDNGSDFMFYRMRDRQGKAQRFSSGVFVGPGGEATPVTPEQIDLHPTRYWRSKQGTPYPVAWRLQAPDIALDLEIEAAFDDQEMPLTVRYWEGAVKVHGSHPGVGYMELSGYGGMGVEPAE
jgi:predicted secreted hydrolase